MQPGLSVSGQNHSVSRRPLEISNGPTLLNPPTGFWNAAATIESSLNTPFADSPTLDVDRANHGDRVERAAVTAAARRRSHSSRPLTESELSPSAPAKPARTHMSVPTVKSAPSLKEDIALSQRALADLGSTAGSASSASAAPNSSQWEEAIVRAIGLRNYEHWFRGQSHITANEQALTVHVGSEFLRTWLQKQFRTGLQQAATELAGAQATVEFLVDHDRGAPSLARTLDNASAGRRAAGKGVGELSTGTPGWDASISVDRPSRNRPVERLSVVANRAAVAAAARANQADQHEAQRREPRSPSRSSLATTEGDAEPIPRNRRSLTRTDARVTASSPLAGERPAGGEARLATPRSSSRTGGVDSGEPEIGGMKAAAGSIVKEAPSSEAGVRPSRRLQELADFVSGPCNELALTAALQVGDAPGARWNPLYLHGNVGTGKTHLVEGIFRRIRRQHPQLQVVLLSAETFGNQFSEALRQRTLPSFRQRFRSADVLLVDDLDFLDGKQVFQEEFLHTFKQLEVLGKQVVVTADRHPRLLTGTGDELVSRLVSGLVCRVENPDLETRRKILQQKSSRMDHDVSPEALQLVAQRFTGNVRELEGALHTLSTWHGMTGKRVTLSAARTVLADLERDCVRIVRLGDVENTVCRFFGVTADDLRSSRRERTVSQPRMLAMYLARRMTQSAYNEIGRHFGGRNHSTVMSAERKVQEWLDGDARLQVAAQMWNASDLVNALEQQLRVG